MHTLAYRMFMSTPNYNISFSCLETGSSCVILREITQWVLHATSVDELSRFDDKQLVKHTIYYFAEQQISDTQDTSGSSSYHVFKLSSHVLWNLKLNFGLSTYLDRNFGVRLLLSESLSQNFEVWTRDSLSEITLLFDLIPDLDWTEHWP